MTARFGEPGFLEAWGRAWSAADPADLLAMHDDDVVYEDVGSSVEVHGHEGLAGFFRWMLKFAPDSEIAFLEAHGDASGFASKWRWSGTAAGRLLLDGVVYPAAEKRFSVVGVAYCELAADGRIASHRDYYDMLDVLKQLGLARQAVPAPEGAAS